MAITLNPNPIKFKEPTPFNAYKFQGWTFLSIQYRGLLVTNTIKP
jgi:hypothetical protein